MCNPCSPAAASGNKKPRPAARLVKKHSPTLGSLQDGSLPTRHSAVEICTKSSPGAGVRPMRSMRNGPSARHEGVGHSMLHGQVQGMLAAACRERLNSSSRSYPCPSPCPLHPCPCPSPCPYPCPCPWGWSPCLC